MGSRSTRTHWLLWLAAFGPLWACSMDGQPPPPAPRSACRLTLEPIVRPQALAKAETVKEHLLAADGVTVRFHCTFWE